MQHSGRVRELDGLRALAILPVLATHFRGGVVMPLLQPLIASGWMGVDLFFVLSGYLITGILVDSVGAPRYYGKFIFRRTVRIFPLYYIALAFMIGLWLFHGLPLLEWDSPAWFLVYLGNIPMALYNAVPRVEFMSVLWSLQVEEQFYLLFPFVVSALSRVQLRRLLLACVCAAPALRVVLALAQPDNIWAPYMLMPSRMDALSIGGLIALARRDSSLPDPSRARWMCASALAAVVSVVAWRGTELGDWVMRTAGYSLIAITAGLVLTWVLVTPSGILTSVLRWGPLVYTGQISYGLYLFHQMAAAGAVALIAPWKVLYPGGKWRFALSMLAAFAVASLARVTVERWGQRLRARLETDSDAPENLQHADGAGRPPTGGSPV